MFQQQAADSDVGVHDLQVQKGAMVAAGSLVAPNTTVPTGEIWAGNPAKKLRELDAEEAEFILQSAVNYSALARIHAAENAKTTDEIEVSRFIYANLLPVCQSLHIVLPSSGISRLLLLGHLPNACMLHLFCNRLQLVHVGVS